MFIPPSLYDIPAGQPYHSMSDLRNKEKQVVCFKNKKTLQIIAMPFPTYSQTD